MTMAGDARQQTAAAHRRSPRPRKDEPRSSTNSRGLAADPDSTVSTEEADRFESVSDEYVASLEESVRGEDHDGSRLQPLAQNLARRAADHQLLQHLARCGFSGPAQEGLEAELAAYAYPVMMAWTRSGEIIKKAAEKGRPLSVGDHGPGWSRDDRSELSAETIARALVFFRTQVLQAGRWDPGRGATIKTYFIGACLFQFPNVYRRWDRERRHWHDNVIMTLDDPDDPARLSQIPGDDDPADTALAAMQRDQILAELSNRDPILHRAFQLRREGYTDTEAAKLTGLTARALEGRWYRFTRDLRRRLDGGKRK